VADRTRRDRRPANDPGLWPAISGVETAIPVDRRIDGVAEVTALSTRLARFASAVHGYEVSETLTFVKDGKELPRARTP
jgi:hypothetical protein